MEIDETTNNHVPYELEDGLWMVPCKVDKVFRKFYPLCRPVYNDGSSSVRHAWSQKEDETLIDLIDEIGPKKWKAIAQLLNERLHKNKEFRLGKQCRERWYNHLNPDLKKGEWTLEEDIQILALKKKYGNRWSLISKVLRGRTENSVKNRWKSIFRKNKKSDSKVEETLGDIQEEKGGEVGEGFGGFSDDTTDVENSSNFNFMKEEFEDQGFKLMTFGQISEIYSDKDSPTSFLLL